MLLYIAYIYCSLLVHQPSLIKIWISNGVLAYTRSGFSSCPLRRGVAACFPFHLFTLVPRSTIKSASYLGRIKACIRASRLEVLNRISRL